MQHGHIGQPCWALTKPGSIHINFMRYKTMSNENNTNAPRVPLTPDQAKARDAALAASKGADQPKPLKTVEAALADIKVTVDHKPQGDAGKAVDTAKPVAVASKTPDLPAGSLIAVPGLGTVQTVEGMNLVKAAKPATGDAVSKAIDTLVKAAETVPANALVEGKGKATVLPDLTKPSTVADADHKAGIAKANANVGKAQGGTVKAKGKGDKTPTPAPVTAAKAKKLTKAETALANPAFVEGYNVAKWPAINSPVDGKPVPAPTRVDIIAAKALDQTGSGPTANRLALAFYLSANAKRLNLYEASMLGGKYVCGLSGDHKMNVASKAEGDNLGTIDKSTHLPWSNGAGGGRAKVCYQFNPSAKGLKLITVAVEAAGLKVPARWLPAPSKPADKGKANPASGT